MVQSVGKFSNTLQTYQKIDICTFILGKMPVTPLNAVISSEDSQVNPLTAVISPEDSQVTIHTKSYFTHSFNKLTLKFLFVLPL